MTCNRCVLAQFTRTARMMLAFLLLFLGAAGEAGADAAPDLSPKEFKAAFLSKILPYVTWPSDSLPKADQPVIVGLFSYDPFDGLVQKLLQTETINGHKVEVTILTDPNRIAECQVLYVPDEKLAEFLKLKPVGAGHGVLTVAADSSGRFLKSGGVFNLLVDERKLEISRGNAEKAGLKINSKLLRISKVN